MAVSSCVVTFRHGEKVFGAGVLINRRFVLTASGRDGGRGVGPL
ncbi:hypothetical protein OHA21_10460 [Actinoplanes sp. NBC_00393]